MLTDEQILELFQNLANKEPLLANRVDLEEDEGIISFDDGCSYPAFYFTCDAFREALAEVLDDVV